MYDKPIETEFKENPDTDISNNILFPKENNLPKRTDLYKKDILKFLFSIDLQFDNNLGKMALRKFKVKNKISGCFRNPLSGEFFCRLRSFLNTFSRLKIPLFLSIIKNGSFQFTN